MKTRILSLLVPAVVLILVLESFMNAPNSFGTFGYAGDPAGGNLTCKSCHSGPMPVTDKSGWITSNIPVTGYVPGSTYTVTATASAAGHTTFGFEITPQNQSGIYLGSLATLNTQTQLDFNPAKPRISHTTSGINGAGSKTWTFTWTAPGAGAGPVTFYGMFNVTNNDNSGTGDTIYSSKTMVMENTMSVAHVAATDPINIAVFPNPVAEKLNVQFGLDKSGTVEILLIDMHGKTSTLMPLTEVAAGQFEQSFSINGQYGSGPYLVKVKIGNKSSYHKVMIGD